jgi:hypothetical protein
MTVQRQCICLEPRVALDRYKLLTQFCRCGGFLPPHLQPESLWRQGLDRLVNDEKKPKGAE